MYYDVYCNNAIMQADFHLIIAILPTSSQITVLLTVGLKRITPFCVIIMTCV